MRELQFTYGMNLTFDAPVRQHRFTLKCIPVSGSCQEISDRNVKLFPGTSWSESRDSFGNVCIFGYEEEVHDHFSVLVTGTARTGLSASEPAGPLHRMGRYRYQTDCTRPGSALRSLAAEHPRAADCGNLDRAVQWMEVLSERFSYAQGVTGIGTTAEEAFLQGKGVCQDYAHILLSLLRMEQIPCRYVVGMMMGEGASHAWVEVWDREQWFAVDPTNHLIVTDQHIRISAGRDYQDCRINQGVFLGAHPAIRQTQEIRVKVEEILP